jgi:hypothetical protein
MLNEVKKEGSQSGRVSILIGRDTRGLVLSTWAYRQKTLWVDRERAAAYKLGRRPSPKPGHNGTWLPALSTGKYMNAA